MGNLHKFRNFHLKGSILVFTDAVYIVGCFLNTVQVRGPSVQLHVHGKGPVVAQSPLNAPLLCSTCAGSNYYSSFILHTVSGKRHWSVFLGSRKSENKQKPKPDMTVSIQSTLNSLCYIVRMIAPAVIRMPLLLLACLLFSHF
jgi:hypothetical protein